MNNNCTKTDLYMAGLSYKNANYPSKRDYHSNHTFQPCYSMFVSLFALLRLVNFFVSSCSASCSETIITQTHETAGDW